MKYKDNPLKLNIPPPPTPPPQPPPRHSAALNVSDPRYSATYGNPYLRSPPKVVSKLVILTISMAYSKLLKASITFISRQVTTPPSPQQSPPLQISPQPAQLTRPFPTPDMTTPYGKLDTNLTNF